MDDKMSTKDGDVDAGQSRELFLPNTKNIHVLPDVAHSYNS